MTTFGRIEMINYLSPDFLNSPGRKPPDSVQPRSCKVTISPATAGCDVSIITPYFNTDEVFLETAESIRLQTLQNWEWVIVDDGSTDEASLERLSRVGASDPRIRIVRQENGGPSSARNTSFRESQGRYVCLLDSDDALEPTYLEKCVWFLESNPNFAFCNTYTVIFGDENFLWTTGFERGKEHLKANSGPLNSVIRRDAFVAAGGFDESIKFGHEDWDFWLALAKTGHWGYTIPEFLQWYRKRRGGRFSQVMSTAGVNDQFESLMRRKYADLDTNFPAPSRRHPEPYEDVPAGHKIHNIRSSRSSGRSILFLVPWMVTGGADRVNLDLVEGLSQQGHDVAVCATLAADHKWEHEFCRLTADVFVLPNFLHQVDYPRFLAYLVQSRHIDTVVITGSTLGYKFVPYLRSAAPHVAFVDICHVEEPHWLNGGHARFAVAYQTVLDMNIATTQNLAAWMLRRGAEVSRIGVMHTGIRAGRHEDIDRQTTRLEIGVANDVPLIIFAGRLGEQKRPAVLAAILKGLRDRDLQFNAVIIGDGELRPQLEKLVRDYRLSDSVRLLGSVAHPRWLEVLASSDILLMPSQYEGISVALLEALACGVVPVVARVGGQDEVVTAEAGILVPHGDSEIEAYVSEMTKLLTDHTLRATMSSACLAIAESKLSWQGMIQRFLDIVDQAHELRSSSPRVSIPKEFATELAVQAFEYNRLDEAVHSLWSAPRPGSTAPRSVEAEAVARVAVALSQTSFARRLMRSPWVRAAGKRVLGRLGRT